MVDEQTHGFFYPWLTKYRAFGHVVEEGGLLQLHFGGLHALHDVMLYNDAERLHDRWLMLRN